MTLRNFVCIFIEESTLFNNENTVELLRLCKHMPSSSRPRIISFVSFTSSSSSSTSVYHEMNSLIDMINGQAYRMTNSSLALSSHRIAFKNVPSTTNKEFVAILQEFIRSFVNYLNISFQCDLFANTNALETFIRTILLKERSIHESHKRLCAAHLVLEIVDTIEIGQLMGLRKSCERLNVFLNRQMKENDFSHVWNKKELGKMGQLVNQLGSLLSSSSSYNEIHTQKYKALIEVLREESQCQRRTIIYVTNKRYF